MGADFKLDPNFEKSFLPSPAVRKHVEEVLEPVLTRAIQTAPDDPRTTGSDLKSKIELQVTVIGGRVVGRIVSRDWRSRFLHAGTSKMTARPWLRKAAESFGFKIEKGPGK